MKLKSIVLILLITITNFNLTKSQSSDYGIHKCKNNTNTNIFKQDITKSLNSLPRNVTSHGGFYNSTAGTRVTSTALCRGDIGPNECEKCVKTAIPSLLRNCPNHADAAAWYSDCIVRFSHGEIVGVLDMWTSGEIYNSASVDEGEVSEFSEALSELTGKLTVLAANGGSVRKLGFGNVTVVVGSGLVRTIYALMQCTPDLSKEMCRKCLFNASEEIGKCCRGRIAVRVFYPNCFLRYSNEHFYNDPPLISSSGEANSGYSWTWVGLIKLALGLECLTDRATKSEWAFKLVDQETPPPLRRFLFLQKHTHTSSKLMNIYTLKSLQNRSLFFVKS